MKKRKRMIAIVLAALTIALMLPMGSVQALKEKVAMRPEPETKPESWQSDENTFENKTSNSENADMQVLQTSEALDEEFGSEPPIASTGQKLENESIEREMENAPTGQEPENEPTEQRPKDSPTKTDMETQREMEPTEPNEEPNKTATEPQPETTVEQTDSENSQVPNNADYETQDLTAKVAQGVSAKIKDDNQTAFLDENHQYIKKIVHTITLTGNKSILSQIKPYSTTEDIYERISYVICQKTDEGELPLQEGTLEIPPKSSINHTQKIEALYKQAGDYCIRVKGTWRQDTEVEFACYDFSIEKEGRKLSLKKNTQNLEYGEKLYIDDIVRMDMPYAHLSEYEIKEESGERNKILEIGEEYGRIYIKACGLNGADKGLTAVTIQLKENALIKASDIRTLKIIVNPIRLTLKAQTDASQAYLYEMLAVNVQILKGSEDVTEKLLEAENGMSLDFFLRCKNQSYEVNSKTMTSEKGSPYQFHFPVTHDFFKEFSKGANYTMTIRIKGDDTTAFFPYKANTVTKSITLLGRRAKIKLSAERDGVYDYRTCYGGTPPLLFVAVEDIAPPESAEALKPNQSIMAAEAGTIKYQISTTDPDVASVDESVQYTANENKIPLHINGTGTTTLTVTGGGSSVYTVESNAITITVKNSPLYDTDFEICVTEKNVSKPQSFTGDANQTGFEKWQTYLKAHNGWINGSVQICLTDVGKTYYDLLNLTPNEEGQTNPSEPFHITGDRKKTSYTFWAQNTKTGADTQHFADKEKGTRSFELGIDTIAPVIAQFVPDLDFYAPTSTEQVQYFPGNFVLTGSFTDETSGVETIEYTADMNAQNGASWIPLGKQPDNGHFSLVLENGIYPAIAVRAVDAAGNVSEPACLKNEDGAFIKIIVDNTPPSITVSVDEKADAGEWQAYNADNENWTNREIRFQIAEKEVLPDEGSSSVIAPVYGSFAGLCRVEYAYQSIAAALAKEPVNPDQWQELAANEQGIAALSLGGDCENPVNQNGYYYFRGVSRSGVRSASDTKVRILLWQKMADKEPIAESGADLEKCHNGWYNKASGTPVIDFAYPKYDTGVSSGEYAAPITIHYNLNKNDEKEAVTSLAENKTATIRADFSQINSPIGFTTISDDLSQMQAKLSDDGIYTLDYWITDAAGNESGTDTYTYRVDCHEPTGLKLVLDGVQQVIGNENTLVYEHFYQNSVSGEASAEYGISGKGSIKLLKAKTVNEWKGKEPTDAAERFEIAPNMRCLLYIRAIDGAGNMTEGWTRGIIDDNEAPSGEGTTKLIVEPSGANKHGFFNKDVNVKISIQDAPNDGNSAGIKLVTCAVGTDEGTAISDKTLFSSTEELVSEGLLSETERFQIIETIDAKANEGNHVLITVSATDRCGNLRTDTQALKIDVTKPELAITFDNENATNGNYYNADRRAKITIKELNFDASLVKLKATRNGADYMPTISDWKHDDTQHYAYIDFSQDGAYTLTAQCRDLADNESEKESVEPFIIDKTKPKVEIALESGASQKGYFNEKQTVTITVTEHNFNADDFHINIQPGGSVGSWEHKNDTHVIKVEYLSEGEYAVSCDYQDLAGNGISDEDRAKMPLEFVIDTTKPVIEIAGVEDNSANAGTVIPSITVQDTNFDFEHVTIMLTTGKGAAVDISADITAAFADNGFCYTLNGLDAKPDDIYYLTVNAADLAGNHSELAVRFSLNRRGSAYDLADLAKLKENYYNCYRNLEDIKIVEMNVDEVEEFTMYLSHNANILYGKRGSRPSAQGENAVQEAVLYSVDVSGNEDTGYVYTYTVYRENFAREGVYRLGIYSKDRAGNEVNNMLRQNGEEIQFAIDNTVPRVMIDGVENNAVYNVSSQEVRVVAEDNFKLANMELTLVNGDGEVLECWNYFDLVEQEGDTATITIAEHDEEVSLLYNAADAAGNEVRTLQNEKNAKTDFLVTTDKFVQLVNNPSQAPFGRGIAAALVLSLISLAGIVSVLVPWKKASLKK